MPINMLERKKESILKKQWRNTKETNIFVYKNHGCIIWIDMEWKPNVQLLNTYFLLAARICALLFGCSVYCFWFYHTKQIRQYILHLQYCFKKSKREYEEEIVFRFLGFSDLCFTFDNV